MRAPGGASEAGAAWTKCMEQLGRRMARNHVDIVVRTEEGVKAWLVW
jgi:hypothetical protein